MTKPTTSWWVPVSSFAIAVLLAFLVGPKSSLYARPPAGGTGGAPTCFCDVKNLDVTTSFTLPDITANATYDFEGGIPGADSNTWLDHYGYVVLTVTTKLPSGAPGPNSTLEVDMKAKKPKNLIKATGVILTPGNKFDLSCTSKDLNSRVRSAMAKLGSNITGETLDSRWPLVMKVHIDAVTTEKLGTKTCKDDITLTFSTEVDLLGNGSGHGNQP